MAKGLLIIAALATVFALAYWLAPDERRYEVREALGLLGDATSLACLEAIETNGQLNNPPSIQLLSAIPQPDGGVFITYRSKNTFDAWATDHFTCKGRNVSLYGGQVWGQKAQELLDR